MRRFPVYRQLDSMDCGPTCLKIIAKYYGREYSLSNLRKQCHVSRDGVSLLEISEVATSMGFNTSGVQITIHDLSKIVLPCIVHWNHNHFVVVYKVKKMVIDL